MPRAIWAGAISLGLVSIPVRLFPATRRQDLRFRELDRVTGRRLEHRRVRVEVPEESGARPAPRWTPEPPLPREVAAEDVVKGFEVSPGRFVAVEKEELVELEPERSRAIDVELFVESAAVDPIHYDAAYHVVPNLDQARPFAVLQEAMSTEQRIALCWVVLRTRRHLSALRPYGDGLLLSTMYLADEILPVPGAGVAGAALSEREREMARLLVRTLSGPFELAQFRDEYRDRVLRMIGERGEDAVAAPEPVVEPASTVEDLLAALKASIDQAKARRSKERPAREA